jgi:competence protein ComEA
VSHALTHQDPPTGAGRRLARVLPPADQPADPPPDPLVESLLEPAAAPLAGLPGEPLAALRDEPPAARSLARLGGAAFDPGRPGVRVLASFAAVVVLAAAALAWWSRPRPEPVVPQLAATAPPSVRATAPAELVVAVTGKVREPGLVRLPAGARVADAIEAAGGVLPGAELDYLNLARKLADGELVVVGLPGAGEQAGGADGVPGAKVNLNTAGPVELETLPGVGPALARRIIDYRERNGPFGSVSELRQVSGIGEVRYAELRDLVTV